MEFEFIVKILNAILGIAAVILAIGVMARVKGGALESVWKIVSVAAVFFGLLEVTGLLAASEVGLNIPNIEDIREVLEFLAIATLAFALMKAKKAFTL